MSEITFDIVLDPRYSGGRVTVNLNGEPIVHIRHSGFASLVIDDMRSGVMNCRTAHYVPVDRGELVCLKNEDKEGRRRYYGINNAFIFSVAKDPAGRKGFELRFLNWHPSDPPLKLPDKGWQDVVGQLIDALQKLFNNCR